MNAKRIPMIVKHQQFVTIWTEHMTVSVRAVIADITRVVFKVSLVKDYILHQSLSLKTAQGRQCLY